MLTYMKSKRKTTHKWKARIWYKKLTKKIQSQEPNLIPILPYKVIFFYVESFFPSLAPAKAN